MKLYCLSCHKEIAEIQPGTKPSDMGLQACPFCEEDYRDEKGLVIMKGHDGTIVHLYDPKPAPKPETWPKKEDFKPGSQAEAIAEMSENIGKSVSNKEPDKPSQTRGMPNKLANAPKKKTQSIFGKKGK